MRVYAVRRTVLAAIAAVATLLALAATSPTQSASARSAGSDATSDWVSNTVAAMSTKAKVGQLFIQEVYGSDAEAPDQRNRDLYGVDSPADVVRKYQLGGVIYFAWTDSLKNPEQITRLSNGLQRAALSHNDDRGIPLAISIDQEQGVVTRIGPPATQFPGAMALGAGRSATDAASAAKITGRELRAMGVNANWAPVADVNVNPANPVIGVRSFSSDPELVATLVAAQVDGYQNGASVSSTAKHFPGHGDTDVDSHVAFPIINHTREQWEQLDAPPFRAAIAQGIDSIMTAHLSFPALDDSGDPATLSKPVLTGLLREELGYDGVIVTDSLAMEGVRERYSDGEVAVRALEAGADQLLMTPAMDVAYAAVLAAIDSGRLPMAEIDAKVTRILSLKQRRGIVQRPLSHESLLRNKVGTERNLRTAAAIADRTTTLVRNDDGVLPMTATGGNLLVTGSGAAVTATLADELTKAGAPATSLDTGAAPTDAQVDAAVAAAAGKDAVVVATNRAWSSPRQQALVKALQETGIAVIVIAVRDPYDVAWLPDTSTYLATYSFNAVALRAAVRVMTGKVNPTGTLPVEIPSVTRPGEIEYPFGHGLSYPTTGGNR